MIGILLGIPGKLQTLLTRITSTGGANLDSKLDATVSSRAAAATALSTAQWTNARAGYLDVLNAGGLAQETTPILDVPIASGEGHGLYPANNQHPFPVAGRSG